MSYHIITSKGKIDLYLTTHYVREKCRSSYCKDDKYCSCYRDAVKYPGAEISKSDYKLLDIDQDEDLPNRLIETDHGVVILFYSINVVRRDDVVLVESDTTGVSEVLMEIPGMYR